MNRGVLRNGHDVIRSCYSIQRLKGKKKNLQLLGVSRKYSTTMINMPANPCDRLDSIQEVEAGYVTCAYALTKNEKKKKKEKKNLVWALRKSTCVL